jgi:hypothetical protein
MGERVPGMPSFQPISLPAPGRARREAK